MPELIIILGEGNYSFALEFVRMLRSHKLLDSTYEVLASDFLCPLIVVNDGENDNDSNHNNKNNVQQQENQFNNYNYKNCSDPKTQDNIRKLIMNYGVRIWTDLDARNLHNHPRLMTDLKSAVNLKRIHFIFNFPHVQTSKMKIDLNRSLLRETFMSIEDLSRVCSVEAIVYISLCHGQSGINQIEPKNRHRSWSDSWQLTEMASYGNFILVNVCPFSFKTFKKLFCDNVAKKQSIYDSNYKFWELNNKENDLLQQSNNNNNNNNNTNNEELSFLNEEFQNYDPFGYRQQCKPFGITSSSSNNNKKFEGGNIFMFEHRDFKLDCFIPRIIYTHPLSSNILVRRFIDDIGEIILENIHYCRSVKPYLIEKQCTIGDHCNKPMDVYILSLNLMDSAPQNQFHAMSNIVGKYLKDNFIEDLLTEDLCIDDINFGFWSRDEHTKKLLSLNLLVENCLKIKWNITDVRTLYSKYFHFLENPSEPEQKIPTTGSLYPQKFYRDFSFWWHGPQTFQQNQFLRIVWDHFQPTNLCSIHLREKYIKSMEPMMISYCFRLVIQSVDLALNRQKVHDLITTLGIRITGKFPQIKIR